MAGESEFPESPSVTTNLIFNTPLMARPMSEEELLDSYSLDFFGVDLLVLQKVLLEAMKTSDDIDLYFHSGITLMNFLFQISDLRPDLIKGQEFEKLITTVSVGFLARYKSATERGQLWEIKLAKDTIESTLNGVQSCSSISEEFKTKLIREVKSELA